MLNEKGQSSIEFIIVIMFALSLFFLLVVQSYNFATGYLAHFANYMASRTYLSHDVGSMNSRANNSVVLNAAQAEALRVFRRYKLDIFIKNISDLEFNKPLTNVVSELVGTYFTFEQPISLFKIIGGGAKVKLRTESFLGKEPSRAECKQQICQAMFGQDCDSIDPGITQNMTLFDNGC